MEMMMIDVDDMSMEVVHCVVDHIEDIEESAKRSPALQTTWNVPTQTLFKRSPILQIAWNVPTDPSLQSTCNVATQTLFIYDFDTRAIGCVAFATCDDHTEEENQHFGHLLFSFHLRHNFCQTQPK